MAVRDKHINMVHQIKQDCRYLRSKLLLNATQLVAVRVKQVPRSVQYYHMHMHTNTSACGMRHSQWVRSRRVMTSKARPGITRNELVRSVQVTRLKVKLDLPILATFRPHFQCCDLLWPTSIRLTPAEYRSQSGFQFCDLARPPLWIFLRTVQSTKNVFQY